MTRNLDICLGPKDFVSRDALHLLQRGLAGLTAEHSLSSTNQSIYMDVLPPDRALDEHFGLNTPPFSCTNGNCSACHSERSEESPPSGVEALPFIQGDIKLVSNYSGTEQSRFRWLCSPMLGFEKPFSRSLGHQIASSSYACGEGEKYKDLRGLVIKIVFCLPLRYNCAGLLAHHAGYYMAAQEEEAWG